jgi:anti-sigma regulatory factor (Ser/Thr protein kinase)
MSTLHKIAGCDNPSRQADVLFLHGLGGDPLTTWQHGAEAAASWPHWLGEEFGDVGVWSLGYAASPTKWLRLLRLFGSAGGGAGYAMPLPDRALQVLDLMVQKGFGQRPLFFICHSLGGLLAKQILRKASEATDLGKRTVFTGTRAVLFLATPHGGASLASLAGAFRTILGATVSLEDLRAHDAHLRELLDWYRNHAADAAIKTVTYYETRNVLGARIVDETSSHPGVGDDPVGLDDDHLSIVKPHSREAQVYCAACKLLRDHVLPRSPAPDATPPSTDIPVHTDSVVDLRTAPGDEWSREFAASMIHRSINPAAASDVNLLLARLEEALGSEGFAPNTIDKAHTIASELLTNVKRHAPGSAARFAMHCQTTPLRYIQLWVGDDGGGFDLRSTLGQLRLMMKGGEREHGLLRVHRLSSLLDIFPVNGSPAVVVDIYEKDRPASVFFEIPGVAPIMLQYENPKLLWLGDQLHADQGVFNHLHLLAEDDNRSVLECYFAHLSDIHPKCLVVEVRGHKVATEPLPGSLSCLRAALELYFDDFFSSGRVIWLAGDTEPFVRREVEQWANAWRLTSYRDEAGAREAVNRVLHGT